MSRTASAFRRSAASRPLPPPSSTISRRCETANIAATCVASATAKSEVISGAVTKSPAAPSFVAPAA